MDNAHYPYNFGFFSCPKSQVESFLIINIFFIVNNTEFLQEESKKAAVNVQTVMPKAPSEHSSCIASQL